jgi:competence protein ComEA
VGTTSERARADAAAKRLLAATGQLPYDEGKRVAPRGPWAIESRIRGESFLDDFEDDEDGPEAETAPRAEPVQGAGSAPDSGRVRWEERGAAEESWRDRVRDFTKAHVAALLVLLAVAGVFAWMRIADSRAEQVPLAAPSTVVAGSGSAGGDGESGSGSDVASPAPSQAVILVHVLGAVAAPGVVELPEGARVRDALAAAGGLTPDADPAELNLAAVVGDGCQIIVGTLYAPDGRVVDGLGWSSGSSGSSGSGSSGAKVNINTANQALLETLPGVGPVTAQKILAWRDAHGKFTAIAELQEIDGIGPKTMAQLEPYVTV